MRTAAEVFAAPYTAIFQLAKTSKRWKCPKCNQLRFTPYTFVHNNKFVDEKKYGVCGRAKDCGHKENPRSKDFMKEILGGKGGVHENFLPPTWSSRVSTAQFLKSLRAGQSSFEKYLRTHTTFKSELITQVMAEYHIGCNNDYWKGGTVFWQIDTAGDIRSGKIIPYGKDGKRARYPNGKGKVQWEHPKKGCGDFRLEQCFFGTHLITDKVKIIRVVEGEKTAPISRLHDLTKCEVHPEEQIWIGTGGKDLLTWDRITNLLGYKVIVHRDKGCQTTIKHVDYIKHMYPNFDITLDEELESLDKVSKGDDRADLILKHYQRK